MNFNSLTFLIYYPIVLLLYFILPLKIRWIMLLAASYFFYMSWNASLLFLILFTTLISWICSLVIEKTDSLFKKRLCLIITLIVSLGILFFFKYYNFLAQSVSGLMTLFGAPAQDYTLNLILPVGISFYTFQTLSYAIDVYRGDVKTEHHFGYYALFVSFFPQLVAGPIERPDNLLPQLKTPNRPNAEDAAAGLKRMMVGFFKKVVVADLLAGYVNAVYNDAANATGAGIIIATCMFAVQIYCDFSGYTDIAIGCARVMGIRLMQNFDRPYSARSIKEFWARWHISLSTWFRDYLYIPLGGSRCSKARHMTNLMIVFLVSGLWHGADWTFVIWGFLHGAYQIIGHLTLGARKKLTDRMHINRESCGFRIYQTVITFVLVTFAWMFFRANNTADLLVLLEKLFTAWTVPLGEVMAGMGLTWTGVLVSVLSAACMVVFDRLVVHNEAPMADGSLRSTIAVGGGKAVAAVWCIMLAWLILLAGDGASSFIYFQ
ncbi:MAG: MBOAT family protein, partial [Clostridia bacterium]|nr:MBOAT family protein [Clostridia bacterium]